MGFVLIYVFILLPKEVFMIFFTSMYHIYGDLLSRISGRFKIPRVAEEQVKSVKS